MKQQRALSQRVADEKVSMEWRDIKFSTYVKDPKNSKFMKTAYSKRCILNGLSGTAKSGELIAIMGPTGSGKTSFLNALAARFPDGGSKFFNLSGSFIVNGKPRNDDFFRRISAFVTQVS